MAIGKTKERKKERKLTHAIKKIVGKKNKATRDDGVISLTPEIGEKLSVFGLAKLDSVVLRGDLFPLGVFFNRRDALQRAKFGIESRADETRGGRESDERIGEERKEKRGKDSVSGIGIPSSGRRRRRRRRQAEDQED